MNIRAFIKENILEPTKDGVILAAWVIITAALTKALIVVFFPESIFATLRYSEFLCFGLAVHIMSPYAMDKTRLYWSKGE